MIRFFLASLLLVLTSCVAKKQAAEFEAQPIWMKNKPVESGYYIGVGSAKKVGTVMEYTKNAKKDALTDLAEEISLNISSTSVLHTIESESGIDETFNQTIQVSTEDYLEGFEPMDYYENETSYWVYYRISKSTYLEKKEQKKQQALETAKVKYLAGKNEESQHRAKEAIAFYLQGLQAIFNYLGEETQKEVNGVMIDIGNVLYASLNEVVSEIKIEPVIDQVSVERGKRPETPLFFKTIYKSHIENGLPVYFKYTGGYLQKDKDYSNDIGLVEVRPWEINSRNDYERLTAEINLKEIAQNAVDNLFIRGMLTKHKLEQAVIVFKITKSNVQLSIPNHYCSNNHCEKIRKVFDEIALSEGFNISAQTKIAYTFTINFRSTKGERAGGLIASYVSGELALVNEDQEQIWAKSIKEIKGVGHNSTEANEKAFEKFVSDLDHIYFPEAFDKIK